MARVERLRNVRRRVLNDNLLALELLAVAVLSALIEDVLKDELGVTSLVHVKIEEGKLALAHPAVRDELGVGLALKENAHENVELPSSTNSSSSVLTNNAPSRADEAYNVDPLATNLVGVAGIFEAAFDGGNRDGVVGLVRRLRGLEDLEDSLASNVKINNSVVKTLED